MLRSGDVMDLPYSPAVTFAAYCFDPQQTADLEGSGPGIRGLAGLEEVLIVVLWLKAHSSTARLM